jgi:hypothetical protein
MAEPTQVPATREQPEPTRRRRRSKRWRRRVAATATVFVLTIAALGLLIRWYGAPRVLANSFIATPFVRAFNEVREHLYFARDDDCLRDLADSGLDFRFVAEPRRRDPCPLRNVVRVFPTGLLGRPLYMTCRLALALRRFEQTIVQPTAQRHFGQPVVRLDERGVRNCRPVEGYRSLLSEHAFANAIDIAAFVLRDGTVIDVTAGRGTGPHADFVHEVTRSACGVFRTVLGPGFDERHEAHLHLDMGLLGGCRP